MVGEEEPVNFSCGETHKFEVNANATTTQNNTNRVPLGKYLGLKSYIFSCGVKMGTYWAGIPH